MTPERWRQIESVYESVIDLPLEARFDKLARLCGSDAKLRDEVETLIESTSGASESLRRAVATEANRLFSSATSSQLGRRLGCYRLLELIGEGGMGAVFRAMRIDAEFKRVVAIKILHRGLGTTHAAARFRDERQILATLDHPGIVKLLDGGSTEDGLPYLVMEHIEGLAITKYARMHELSIRKRVELFVKVCAAVQYAHQMLVVHRDLKPGNILVDGSGEPKLLDFGIAKLLDEGASREAHTHTGASMLTPEYASPEQARSEPVTTASDVYSLGAVLYDLLADRPPLDLVPNALESLRAICEVEPQRPSTVAPVDRQATIVGDLDNIVLKALWKEPSRRYATAAQLADDLQRYLDGLPVAARTPTFGYRAGKFVRRHRGKLALAAAVAVSLTTATVASLHQAKRADAQARRADAEANRAKQRFEETRKLAGAVMFELDDKIRDLAGATAARKLVVSRAIEYLDVLARDADANLDTQLDLAFAYMKVGDIQGNANQSNLGQPHDGLVSYVKAATIINRLNVLGYGTPRLREADGLVRAGIGMMQASLVQPRASQETLQGVRSYWRTLPSDQQPSLELQVRVIERLAQVTSEPRAFLRYCEEGIALAEKWAATGTPEGRYWHGVILEMAGPGAAANGDAEAGLAYVRKAAEIQTKLSHDFPEDARFLREVGIANAIVGWHAVGVGNALLWQPAAGDIAEAERVTRIAVDAFRRLAKQDPDDARNQADVGLILGAQGATVALRNPIASIPIFEESIATFEAMAPKERASPYAQQNEWFTHCAIAEPLAVAGRRAEALREIETGLAITQAIGEDVRANQLLPMCQYMIGRAYLALGDRAAAVASLEIAAKALTDSLASTGIDKRIGLVEVLRALAIAKPSEACALMRRASATWRAWSGQPTAYVRRQQVVIDRDLATACR